jgi:uncharacterized protein (TIRG00374 family)
MRKTICKRLLLPFKIALAAVLLLWVLSGAHWDDYVLGKDGRTWAWLDRGENSGKYVAESYLTALLHGRTQRETRMFEPAEFVPVDLDAPLADWEARFVRSGIGGSLADMRVGWFVAGVLGFPLSLLVVALRWWFLLKIQGIYISFWEIIRLTFLGQFFNQVVPGTVGGDLVKAWYVRKHTPRVGAVLVSLFVDRVMGLVELVLMAGVMLGVVLVGGLGTFERLRPAAVTLALAGALVVCAMTFLLSARLRKLLRLQKLYQRLPIAHHFQAAGNAARIYRRRLGVLVRAVAVTLGAHLLFVGAVAMLGLALRLDVPGYAYFVCIPLIYIIGAVPITPGGVGLVEKLYVGFFTTTAVAGSAGGVGASEIVALAMLARLAQAFWGLPGLVVAVTGPRRPKAEDIQAEFQAAEQKEEHRAEPIAPGEKET